MRQPEADHQIAGIPAFCPAPQVDEDSTSLQCALAASSCPVCGRADALMVVDAVVYCVACGYASDGARGCT